MSSFDSPPRGDPSTQATNSQVHSTPALGPPYVMPAGYELPPDPMVAFNQHLVELTPHVYVTWILVGLNVLVFLAMLVGGVSPTEPTIDDLLKWGADFGPRTLSGEWWRTISCTFVHIGVIHILMNMYCLALTGPTVERMFGNAGFAVLYLVAGLGGSVASLWWNPMLVSAGASGAVFGVYGALLGLLIWQHDSVPGEALTQVRNSGLAFVGYNLFFGMMNPHIDNAAHLGGLAAGFLCGLVLSQPLTLESLDGRWLRNLLTIAFGTILIVGGMVAVQSRYSELPLAQIALDNFVVVEERVLNAVNIEGQRAERGEVSDNEFVAFLERDVLPEWRAAKERLAALKGLPLSLERQIAQLVNYAQLREDGWTLLAEAVRKNDLTLVKQGQEKQRLAEEAVNAMKEQKK